MSDEKSDTPILDYFSGKREPFYGGKRESFGETLDPMGSVQIVPIRRRGTAL